MTNLSVEERKNILSELEHALAENTISHGEVIKAIRTKLYGMTQAQYAKFIKVSNKTLGDVERGNTDPRLSVLNKLLAPGGFQVSARSVKRTV